MGISADVYVQLKDYATYMEKDIREVALMAVAATSNEYTKNTAIGYLGQRLLGDMKRMMVRLKERMPPDRPVPEGIYASDEYPPGYVEDDDEGWRESDDEGSGEEGDAEPEEDGGAGVDEGDDEHEMLDASTRYSSNLKNVFGISIASVIAFTVGYMMAKR